MVLAGVDCDKAIVATLRHDERLQAGSTVFLQAALLYSTPGGARRVRVHTLALPVAGSTGAIFRGADLETVVQARSSLLRLLLCCWPMGLLSSLVVGRRVLLGGGSAWQPCTGMVISD